MPMLILAAVVPLLQSFGVSRGGVSGGGVGSSSESSIGLIAQSNPAAFGDSNLAFGDYIIDLGCCIVAFGLGAMYQMSK